MKIFLSLILLVTGCARQFRPTLHAAPSDIGPEDYPAILKLWTREDQAFHGFEHKLTAKATMITPMLRQAFLKRFPEVYGYGGQVTRDELRNPAKEETLSFFLAVYTPNYRWEDLEKPDSIWRVKLQRARDEYAVADTSVDAVAIVKVKRDENLNAIFPYLGAFDVIYVVRFPHTVADKKSTLRMRIVSSFAESVMQWTVEP